MAINWKNAPEGTTHAFPTGPTLWRKVDDQHVWAWRGEWERRWEDPEEWKQIHEFPNGSAYPIPEEFKKKAEEVVAKVAPQAPALVWPKGFVHCRVIARDDVRFFNEKGQIVNGKFHNWAAPQNFEHWQKGPTYIKRPETPLPNGEQWKEGYTHANKHAQRVFQFNNKHYLWQGEAREWGRGSRKHEWFAKRTTIQRYPDNQPLILDARPQAPVEPPKAPPIVKKPVGWWK